MTPTSQRLYFLDWIRIFAFIILIFYHTGMYYVTWDFHIKSPYASDQIEQLMMLSSPWRLGLLFMISGVASSFMLTRTRIGAFVRRRSWRLLLPLLFGMLVIVPPQPYFEVVEKLAYQGSYTDFMRLYLQAYHGFCRGDDCLVLPTWNHLWFVAYLWVYTMLLGATAALAGLRLQRWSDGLGRWLGGWKIMLLPVAVLWALRILLADQFPSTHNLSWDWYNHALYFFLFILGALMATQARIWRDMDNMRWTALVTWLSAWALVSIINSLPEGLLTAAQIQQWRPLWRVIYAFDQWAPMVAICGFGHRHLGFDSARRRYLTQAVFPVYILHQTLIIAMAHWLKPVHLSPFTEGMVLVILTLSLSFAGFEMVRRIPLLRPCFGLGRSAGPEQSRAAPAPQQAPAACITARN